MSEYSRSKGKLTANTALIVGRAALTGCHVQTDGTNNAVVTIYDNATAASGDIIFEATVAGATRNYTLNMDRPIIAVNGLYVAVSGTGASVIPYIA